MLIFTFFVVPINKSPNFQARSFFLSLQQESKRSLFGGEHSTRCSTSKSPRALQYVDIPFPFLSLSSLRLLCPAFLHIQSPFCVRHFLFVNFLSFSLLNLFKTYWDTTSLFLSTHPIRLRFWVFTNLSKTLLG